MYIKIKKVIKNIGTPIAGLLLFMLFLIPYNLDFIKSIIWPEKYATERCVDKRAEELAELPTTYVHNLEKAKKDYEISKNEEDNMAYMIAQLDNAIVEAKQEKNINIYPALEVYCSLIEKRDIQTYSDAMAMVSHLKTQKLKNQIGN